MNPAKASWRYKSPRRKLKAIRKLRASRVSQEDKIALLTIAGSDPDQDVRTAAAQKLCSLGSIATFIVDELFSQQDYRDVEEDERICQLIKELIQHIHDENALFDIVMNAYSVEHGVPRWLDADNYMNFEIRQDALHKICAQIFSQTSSQISSQDLLYQIFRTRTPQSYSYRIRETALLYISDRQMLSDILNDATTEMDFAIVAARELKDDEYLAAVAKNAELPDGMRLAAASRVDDAELKETLLLEILDSPLPGKEELESTYRYDAISELIDYDERRRLYEKMARDPAYRFNDRIHADEAAAGIGGTSILDDIYASATVQQRESICGWYQNGHHWRYNGISLQSYGKYVEYICTLCGAVAHGNDLRKKEPRSPYQRISEEHWAKIVTIEAATSLDERVSLLEQETDCFAIRHIVSKISDMETLWSIARTHENADTRKEAAFALYEIDRESIRRIADEELLYTLAMNASDADDMLYAVNAITNQQYLYDLGLLFLERAGDKFMGVYLAALEKVSDQTKLATIFSDSYGNLRLRGRLWPFAKEVLNRITDLRTLGEIWLDGSVDTDCRWAAGDKAVNPSTPYAWHLVPKSSSEEVIDALAADPVLLEKMATLCCEDTHPYLQYISCKKRVLEKLPPESEAARKLRAKVQSMT